MKKTLLLACTLLLASCIDVMNFGIYWNRGYLEPSLVGTWDPIPVAGQDLGTLKRQRLTIKGDTYVITSYEGGIEKTDAPMVGRLLLVSHLTFLMLGGQTQGALYRYKLEGKDVVKFYNLDKVAAQKFVAEKFPNAKNIEGGPGAGTYGATFGIKNLDSEALQILVAIPDNETYWKLDASYKKAP
ncbi:MAG: hypothetical protein WBK91_10875 [Alphaproteobacteria bacterium]